MNKEIEKKYQVEKIKFIETLPKLLVFEDWNNKLIKEAEAECGFAKTYNFILFPNGLSEIVDYFEAWQDGLMMEYLNSALQPNKIREKIALALKVRIKNLVPKIVHIKNASYFIHPDNVIFANKIAFRTCDLIWRYAGDKSTDFNYYTKRGLLLGVYLSSIAFYIADNSENSSATDKFIDQALQNVINIAGMKNRIKLPKLEEIPILRLLS